MNLKDNPKHLIIDASAVLYKHFFANKQHKVEDIVALAQIGLLYKIQELYGKYGIDNVAVVFDCYNRSWRKVYTSKQNPDKITNKAYKGGRRENMKPSEKKKMEAFDDHLYIFADFFRQQTSLLSLIGDYLEADDIIAGYVQRFSEHDHVIYSADKDFLQLINSIDGTVTLVESQKDTERNLNDYNGDPELFLFEKCFRGEGRGGDNVQSAYPRLRKTKIHEAYTDAFKYNNIINNEFTVGDIDSMGNPIIHEYITKDLLKENRLLMGLNHQPPAIRELINDAIDDGIKNVGKFDYVKFLKFCHRQGIDRVIKEKDKFIEILSEEQCYFHSGGSLGGSVS
jgi:hypothetical protein